MPEGETEVTTPPEAVNSAETEVVAEETVSVGIQKRLDRFENKIKKEQIEPLQQRLEAVRTAAIENGLDLALLGLEPAEATPAVETPAPKAQSSDAATVLLRVQAAYNAGLPPEVLPLVTGTDEATINAQIEALKLMQPRRRSPVVPGPDGKPLPTFKQSQLRDGKFFQANRDAIQKAMKEGRIEKDV